MTVTLVPGVQRPHPTFGVPGPSALLVVTTFGLTTILPFNIPESTRGATQFGCSITGALLARLTTADLTFTLIGFLLTTTVTPLSRLLVIRVVLAGSGSLDAPVSGVVTR